MLLCVISSAANFVSSFNIVVKCQMSWDVWPLGFAAADAAKAAAKFAGANVEHIPDLKLMEKEQLSRAIP